MINLCTKFEVSTLSRFRDSSEGVKFENGSRDIDYAPFRGDLSSAGWDLLCSSCSTYLNSKSLLTLVTKIRKAVQNVENEKVWGG